MMTSAALWKRDIPVSHMRIPKPAKRKATRVHIFSEMQNRKVKNGLIMDSVRMKGREITLNNNFIVKTAPFMVFHANLYYLHILYCVKGRPTRMRKVSESCLAILYHTYVYDKINQFREVSVCT